MMSENVRTMIGLMTEAAIAKMLGVNVRTLFRWRQRQDFPGAENLRISEERDDEICFVLETAQQRDLRPEITELFVKKKIPLLEVHRARLSLEDIFLRILKDGWFQGPNKQ